LRLVGSRSHPDPLLLRMQESLGITDVRPSGSVGVKCALIAEGERDLYIHPVPYMKEWDTCAPEVLIREAGGDVTDCYGDPLRYNKPDPAQPHGIIACAPGVATSVLQRVSPLFAETVFARQSN
jgi:3'(2'), 5'-bisphosphate nucleotidase